jgi:hypothetical protein
VLEHRDEARIFEMLARCVRAHEYREVDDRDTRDDRTQRRLERRDRGRDVPTQRDP